MGTTAGNATPEDCGITTAEGLIAAMRLPAARYEVETYSLPECPTQAAVFPRCYLFHGTRFTVAFENGGCGIYRYDDTLNGPIGEGVAHEDVGSFLDSWVDEELLNWRRAA